MKVEKRLYNRLLIRYQKANCVEDSCPNPKETARLASMNAAKPFYQEMEIHQLAQPYAGLRITDKAAISALARDMEERGQLVPVAVAKNVEGDWVLLDGYRRVAALSQLRRDTVTCEVWPGDPTQGLMMMLARMGGRHWDAFEEGLLLRHLREDQEQSVANIASQTGRSQSWVRSRLQLVADVPEEGRLAIMQGRLNPWVAVRVIVPLSRANPAHARRVIETMAENGLSSREWDEWFAIYKEANQLVRERLVEQPRLLIEAKREQDLARDSQKLAEGPEGKWNQACRRVANGMRELRRLLPAATQGLNDAGRAALKSDFARVMREWEALQKQMKRRQCDVVTPPSRTCQTTPSTGNVVAGDMPPDGHLAQHRSTDHPQETRGNTAGDPQPTSASQRAHSGDLPAVPGQRGARARDSRTRTRDSGGLQYTHPLSARGSPT